MLYKMYQHFRKRILMIKQTLKYLSLASLLICCNLQASTDFLQEPDAQRCINHVRMAEAQRVQPQWLLTYLAIAHDLDFPVLEALAYTGLPLHQPSHENVVAFLKGIKAYQEANLGKNLNLDLPKDLNKSINKMGQVFDPTVPFKMDLGWANNLRSTLPLVSCLTKLTELNLEGNQLTDVSPLATLTGLTKLDLSYNQLTDVSPLATLTGLTTLYLASNQLTDVSPLATLTGLTELSLAVNKLTDVSPLATLTGLTKLYLRENPAVSSQNLTRTCLVFLPTVQIDCDGGKFEYGIRKDSTAPQE